MKKRKYGVSSLAIPRVSIKLCSSCLLGLPINSTTAQDMSLLFANPHHRHAGIINGEGRISRLRRCRFPHFVVRCYLAHFRVTGFLGIGAHSA